MRRDISSNLLRHLPRGEGAAELAASQLLRLPLPVVVDAVRVVATWLLPLPVDVDVVRVVHMRRLPDVVDVALVGVTWQLRSRQRRVGVADRVGVRAEAVRQISPGIRASTARQRARVRGSTVAV
jgi:hypothetical protein